MECKVLPGWSAEDKLRGLFHNLNSWRTPLKEDI